MNISQRLRRLESDILNTQIWRINVRRSKETITDTALEYSQRASRAVEMLMNDWSIK